MSDEGDIDGPNEVLLGFARGTHRRLPERNLLPVSVQGDPADPVGLLGEPEGAALALVQEITDR